MNNSYTLGGNVYASGLVIMEVKVVDAHAEDSLDEERHG